ncbi:MAG: HAMP domain-containing protein [Candidatus Saganbacteria bacterium]|nr:HAMP domain-containing protein [Candidatus Saganbacteria bacterium]
MEFKDLKMPIKQMMGYLIGVLLLTILYSLSIAHFSTVASEYNGSMRVAWRHLNSLQDLRAFGLQVKVDIYENPLRAENDLDRMTQAFNILLQGGVSGLPRDLTLLVKDMLLFRGQAQKLIVLLNQNAPAEELKAQSEAFERIFMAFMGRVYVEIEKSKSQTAMAETSYLHRISYLLLLNTILAPLSFAFLYTYGYFLSNYTGLRLKKFTDSFKKILGGNYKARIEDNSKDEIGQIAQGINELVRRLDQ